MSDKLSLLKEVYQNIIDYYNDHIFKSLKNYEEELVTIFKKILDASAEKYDLIHTGSIEDKKYYSIKSRVKSPNSLHEKLVRKNLGLLFINELNLNIRTDLNENNKALLTSKIKNIDDIIGIRVVTELLHDNNQVYEALKDNIGFLKSERIELFDSSQPEIMKNGLPIFKLKGKYKEEVRFELQIKSKIEEAWGEMDHSLFYKDYSFQPIKSTVALTMTNVGHLLEKIENLLFDLRDSSRSFQESAAHLDFLNWLNLEFVPKIADKLNTHCDLTSISSVLRAIKEKYEIQNSRIEELTVEQLEFKLSDKLGQAYLKVREQSHEILFIEIFFFSLRNLGDDFEVGQAQYKSQIKELVDFILVKSKEELQRKFKYPDDQVEDAFNYLVRLMEYLNPNILINSKAHQSLVEILSLTKNAMDELDLEYTPNEVNLFIIPLLICEYFEGDTVRFVSHTSEYSIDDRFDRILESFMSLQEFKKHRSVIKRLNQKRLDNEI